VSFVVSKAIKGVLNMPEELKVAVLDDYASIAPPIFAHVSNLSVISFPETLDPTNESDLSALVERLKPFSVISTCRERTPFQAPLLKALPNLRLLLTTGLRNNGIDGKTARSLDIILTGTTGTTKTSLSITPPDVPPPSDYDATTQQTLALILALASRLPQNDSLVKSLSAHWQSGFITTLGGKTFAALGLGKLGSRAARIAVQAFGMHVIAWSSNMTQEKADEAAVAQGLSRGTFKVVSKEELFTDADVLSVHVVLGDRTRGIVGKDDLARLKSSALFINCSRAALVEEESLFECLKEGRIRGAALDVYWQEPMKVGNKWRTTEWSEAGRSDVVYSPHMGYVSEGTLWAWYIEQAEIIKRWQNGEELLHIMN
jgi:lactate dehydrogenase-like 2-hydroxyacid dehydrogenase